MKMTSLSRALRIAAAVGIVGATSLLAAPVQADHVVEFESHDCPTPTPAPDEEPDLTPPPTEPPKDGAPPPSPTPAPNNCMPVEGDRIWGTRVIAFSVESTRAEPLASVSLRILSQEKAIPHANAGKNLLSDTTYTPEDEIERYAHDCEADDDTCTGGPFSWDSRVVTPYNGKYKIRVDSSAYDPCVFCDGETHNASAERVDLEVDNPPMPVGAPKIVAKTASSITVQWPAAVEPDVTAYTLYRAFTKTSTKPPYSAFKQIAITTGPAFRDNKISPGFHWYAVKVTRRSIVTPETGISSPIGPVSGAAEIKAPSDDDPDVQREIPDFRKPQLVPRSRLASIPDAPFAYQLPVGDAPPGEDGTLSAPQQEDPINDPRGPVLPVAVGMFLVSSALAVGRMPY